MWTRILARISLEVMVLCDQGRPSGPRVGEDIWIIPPLEPNFEGMLCLVPISPEIADEPCGQILIYEEAPLGHIAS
jgi:hypothetical protein